MAAPLPAKLKAADIQRFVHRANQLDKFKPAIAYWCRYQALNQILAKSLQNEDRDCMEFATKLMDTVEANKAAGAEDPAIVDESVAAPYIQRFGEETFERADKTIRTNAVTAQTVDTFQAATTFLDLLNIWAPMPPEVAAKIKYAKFHTVRIAKALKAGEDPNLSNPVQEPTATDNPEQIQLDPNDPEVQSINQAAAHQPTVEDVPDEANGLSGPYQPPATIPQRPMTAPRPVSADIASPLRPGEHRLPFETSGPPPSGGPSPLDSNPRKSSAGGGYFPETVSPPVVTPSFQSPAPHIPSPAAPSAPPATSPSEAASRAFYQHPTPSAPPMQPPVAPISSPLSQTHYSHPPVPTSAALSIPPQHVDMPPAQYIDDDVAVTEAQKHARWAISALNFEDVPTAVKELRQALRTLGAG